LKDRQPAGTRSTSRLMMHSRAFFYYFQQFFCNEIGPFRLSTERDSEQAAVDGTDGRSFLLCWLMEVWLCVVYEMIKTGRQGFTGADGTVLAGRVGCWNETS
jgi:hypothetical protein